MVQCSSVFLLIVIIFCSNNVPMKSRENNFQKCFYIQLRHLRHLSASGVDFVTEKVKWSYVGDDGVVMGSSGCNSSVDVEAGLSRKLGQGHNLRTV